VGERKETAFFRVDCRPRAAALPRSRPLSRFRLAIFDLDGTLVDTLGDISDALNFTLRQMGLAEVPEHLVATMVGEGVGRLLERALGPGAAARVPEALPIFRARYAEHLCDRTRPYPGIPEMLEATNQIKAIATNKPGFMARGIVTALGLHGHFARVLGDQDVERRKPDPMMVERVLAELKIDANRTILIGDGIVDGGAARAAGVAHCAVTWGYTPRDALVATGPDHLADTATDLVRLLKGP